MNELLVSILVIGAIFALYKWSARKSKPVESVPYIPIPDENAPEILPREDERPQA